MIEPIAQEEIINEIETFIDISLVEKISNLPTKPGIYQYFNSSGTIIYVGKAKNLRNRVRSYFQNGRYYDAKTKALVAKISDVEVIVVDTEAEALILEDTLIKKHKPKYNVLLRDDKTFPYIRITSEPYPRVFPTRKVIKDGSKYFGPFTELGRMKHLLRTLRSLFLLRSCDLNINDSSIANKKHKVCLDYHIKKCEGPCEGLVSQEYYNNNIKQSIQILNGKTKDVEKFLENQMEKYAEEMKFEQAAVIRNRLNALKDYSAKQKIITTDLIDRDIFGIAKADDYGCSIVLKIRDGKLIGKRHFIVKNTDLLSDESIIQRTIEKWYLETDFIPKDLYLPNEINDVEYITDWLGRIKGSTINIHIPKVGDKRKMVEMANTNAEFILKEYILAIDTRDSVIPRMVVSLQRDLHLTKPPIRIECFDNSHFQGTDIVSSMVVFEDGKPKKSEYRKYKAKEIEGNDDFATMRETIKRRYTRVVNENLQLPDLIVVDGGKGQLSAAYSIIKELGIDHRVSIIGLAKRLEEVFFPEEPEPIMLPRTSSSLRLIQQLRDEAHRFAITFHRQLRDKRTLQTELTEIKGIGKKTAERLLTELGSVEIIKQSTDEQILQFTNEKVLKALREHFGNKTP